MIISVLRQVDPPATIPGAGSVCCTSTSTRSCSCSCSWRCNAMACNTWPPAAGEGGHKSNAPRSIYANSETGHPKALELPRATALNTSINALYTTLHWARLCVMCLTGATAQHGKSYAIRTRLAKWSKVIFDFFCLSSPSFSLSLSPSSSLSVSPVMREILTLQLLHTF